MTFVAKKGPTFTKGRWSHFLLGLAVTAIAAMWGAIAIAIAFAIVPIFALLWELSTPIMARWFDWPHPWGDLLDLSAYGAGSLLVVILAGLIGIG